MYCTNCGKQLDEGVNFCSQCGKSIQAECLPAVRTERLVRVREGKKIAGVCAGFARYLGVDVTLVRLVWLVMAFTGGIGIIAYIAAWIVMPVEDTLVAPQANTSGQLAPNR